MVNFGAWKSIFLKPVETIQKEKPNSSITEGVKNIVIGSAILAVLFSIGLAFFGALFKAFLPTWLVGGSIALIIAVIIVGLILLEVIETFINVGIIWVIARILGGKGSFAQQYYLTSLYVAPLLAIAILFFIPILGTLLVLVLGLYSLYLLYLIVKDVHAFSTGRAVLAAFVIPIILVIIIGVILVGSILAFA